MSVADPWYSISCASLREGRSSEEGWSFEAVEVYRLALRLPEESVLPRRPASGRIGAMEYRVYRLFQAAYAARQDRENPPDQLRGLIQQSPEMVTIHDEQSEIGRRHDRR